MVNFLPPGSEQYVFCFANIYGHFICSEPVGDFLNRINEERELEKDGGEKDIERGLTQREQKLENIYRKRETGREGGPKGTGLAVGKCEYIMSV